MFSRIAILGVLGAAIVGSVFLGGCSTGELEQGEALRLQPLVNTVVARHDAYVADDADLSAEARAAALDDSSTFSAAFSTPVVRVQPIYDPAMRTLRRYEDYVLADGALAEDVRDRYLFSGRNIRRTLVEAVGQRD